jgi:septal ring factor EnvC (AmiA/AmiB activator)
MSRRAVALYKMGDLGPARLLFSAGDLRDLVARVQRLRTLLARDAELLARHRADADALVAARAAVATAVARRSRAKARLAGGTRALAEERASRRELLAQLRADKVRERAGLEELEAAARALEAKLEDLGRAPSHAPPRSVPFASLRGRLAPPVAAPISRPFGRVVDTEFRTETFRKGVDFAVTLGQPVHAVADGEVRYAGWFRGYGRLVILDHGEQWFTVAGHLGELRVQVGDTVRAGDDLGSAGDTGSLGGAILYFEIRHGSEAVDPSEWLERSPRLD